MTFVTQILTRRVLWLGLGSLMVAAALAWASGGTPTIWSTIDGGGARSSASGLTITGTIGQHDAGQLTRNGWILRGGYWGGGATATAVLDPANGPNALTFRVWPIHPNPFNPSTRIEFELPAPSTVTARVFNLRGELVATLARGEFSAGRHSLDWRGVDRNDRSVGSGVYLFALDAGEHHVRQKITLVR